MSTANRDEVDCALCGGPHVGRAHVPAPATEAKCPGCGRDADFVETFHGARSCYHPFHATPRAGASEGEERPNWRQIAHDALWPDGALPLNGEKHIHKWALLLSAAYERGKADARPTPPPAEGVAS